MDISFGLSNVAETAVAPINANATLSSGGAGNQLIFAGVVVSPKGKPFEVLPVTKDSWQSVLGKPYHSSKGIQADSLRTLSEAVKGGNGVVVRAVPASATYPVIRVKPALPAKSKKAVAVVSEGEGEIQPKAASFAISNEAVVYGTNVTLADDDLLAFFVKDGAQSDNRSITLTAADADAYGAGMFKLVLTETDDAGNVSTLDDLIVSLNPEATDDMGTPVFIETVLENQSKYIDVVCGANVETLTELTKTAFTGASNGSISDLTADDYKKAVAILAASIIPFTYVSGLSCYDPEVIKALIDVSNRRRIGGYYDINPRLNHEQAVEALESMNISEHRASFVHLPYTSKCPFYGNKVVYGASGIGFSAKAKGVLKHSPVGGFQYTPAGDERAVISRTNLKPMPNIGEPDFERMYKARLNKLGVSENGLLFIDDSLTSFKRENYLRFEQVVSVTDAISRDFYALANRLKHLPDGITFDGLNDGMTDILDGYVATGALVPPRDPSDGKEPYKLFVEQVSIDSWKVRWAICVTGSGRRFLGEPELIK